MIKSPAYEPYQFSIEIDEAREEYVTTKLVEYNKPFASPLWDNPPHPRAPLQIYVTDTQGIIMGGLIGRTHAIPEWLEITVIWVNEAMRGHGIGRELMRLAEAEAQERGCHFVKLSTSHYQAPEFYYKLGYRLYGKLENLPRGETDYFFTKEL